MRSLRMTSYDAGLEVRGPFDSGLAKVPLDEQRLHIFFRSALSRLHGPGPAAAKYRKAKQ